MFEKAKLLGNKRYNDKREGKLLLIGDGNEQKSNNKRNLKTQNRKKRTYKSNGN